MASYTRLDYFQMHATWIIVLLTIISVQLKTRRRCINVHRRTRTGGQSFHTILNSPAYPRQGRSLLSSYPALQNSSRPPSDASLLSSYPALRNSSRPPSDASRSFPALAPFFGLLGDARFVSRHRNLRAVLERGRLAARDARAVDGAADGVRAHLVLEDEELAARDVVRADDHAVEEHRELGSAVAARV